MGMAELSEPAFRQADKVRIVEVVLSLCYRTLLKKPG